MALNPEQNVQNAQSDPQNVILMQFKTIQSHSHDSIDESLKTVLDSDHRVHARGKEH